MNKLIQYVPDTDLRSGYTGLSKLLPLSGLKQGEFVAFVNRAGTSVKLCTHDDMTAYLRLPKGQRIDPRVIVHLPEFFNGGTINYSGAIEKVFKKRFPVWFAIKDKVASPPKSKPKTREDIIASI